MFMVELENNHTDIVIQQDAALQPGACLLRSTCLAEMDNLNRLAWELRYSQRLRAYALCQQANQLARSGSFAAQPYAPGLAASLVTMAAIQADWGRLEEAIAGCFEGLSLIADQPLSVVVVDAWTTICWIHLYLGDFSSAMDFGLKALRLSRELACRPREAWALDAVASVYSATGDNPSAVEAHQEALQIFTEIGDLAGQARVLNNFAVSRQGMGSYSAALEMAYQALELDQRLELKMEEVAVYSTLGEIYIDMADYPRAEEALLEGVARFDPHIPVFLQTYTWIDLGKIGLATCNFDQALAHLQQALNLAEADEMLGEQAKCHEMLSEIYELQADLAQALDHYKRFHTLREQVAGEEATKRLAVLKVTHQLETAQRNAEIYRLRNVELQREIQERERAETILARLAMLDPLTGLYNRRQFFASSTDELDRAVRFQHPLSALMMDVDHFKQVNDRFGHLVGDQVLGQVAETIRSGLREMDIIGRFGGEEFAVVLPRTDANSGLVVADRIRQSIAEREFSSGSERFHVTVSIGVADRAAGPGDNLDALLRRADQALYAAKQAGRNKTIAFGGEYR